MEEERLKAILESLLFAAGEPVSFARLAAVLDNVARDTIRNALSEMMLSYGARGIVLDEVAGGYQFRTPKEHALYVRKLLAAKPPRLTRPLLETLAIIAYRQPVTRPEIEQLRGVDSGGVLDTLLERRLVRIAGRKEAPGRPIMYATSAEFLEVFGLRDLDGLPDLEELKELEGGASGRETSNGSEPDVPEEPAATQTAPEEVSASESGGSVHGEQETAGPEGMHSGTQYLPETSAPIRGDDSAAAEPAFSGEEPEEQPE
jgi:segregation and condensation protein B